jgi:hypothetical protein
MMIITTNTSDTDDDDVDINDIDIGDEDSDEDNDDDDDDDDEEEEEEEEGDDDDDDDDDDMVDPRHFSRRHPKPVLSGQSCSPNRQSRRGTLCISFRLARVNVLQRGKYPPGAWKGSRTRHAMSSLT